MTDPGGPGENHLKCKLEESPNQLTNKRHGKLSSTAARVPEVAGDGMSLHVMQGVRNVVMRDSNFYVAQKIEVHEHGGWDDSTLLDVLEGLLSSNHADQIVLEIRKELEYLKAKLEAILSIVKQYQKHNIESALHNQIELFCTAITTQLKLIKDIQKQSLLAHGAKGTKDADTIWKAIRNINSLCDVFQMDTQLTIGGMVDDILQCLKSGSIEKLNHEMTSYKTRQSSHGEPTGCMQGTRVKVLEQLDAWALDANSRRVYWMVGMAGIGKSTIAHTFCENLEARNILGGSFFASRTSEKTRNARLIIPVIAHSLARASPAIKIEVVKAITDDPTLAEPTYINIAEQFKQLIYNSVQTTVSMVDKVVIIDAVNECDDLEVVSAFITLVLEWASKLPLKIFIASRDVYQIRKAFGSRDCIRFCLHEIKKDVVKNDILAYLKTSLARIKDDDSEDWPSSSELSVLVLKKVCEGKELCEVALMRDLLLITIFLRNPLSMEALTSLSLESKVPLYLSRLSEV